MKEELAYRRQKVIEDYGAIKGVIENRLATHDVGSAWFPDLETGKEYLLFRIADAREVWQSFEELSSETDDAAAKALSKEPRFQEMRAK
ncbi:hypothetical protein [Enterorhabdus sp. P55]|uniref:hypothetical protein n=1 Tax=Enterorhabdus sp. P55 TaxID=2304571 RepID=UPI001F1A6A1A|nr:hypothetical protein [Enterorhabdus sp. P55]